MSTASGGRPGAGAETGWPSAFAPPEEREYLAGHRKTEPQKDPGGQRPPPWDTAGPEQPAPHRAQTSAARPPPQGAAGAACGPCAARYKERGDHHGRNQEERPPRRRREAQPLPARPSGWQTPSRPRGHKPQQAKVRPPFPDRRRDHRPARQDGALGRPPTNSGPTPQNSQQGRPAKGGQAPQQRPGRDSRPSQPEGKKAGRSGGKNQPKPEQPRPPGELFPACRPQRRRRAGPRPGRARSRPPRARPPASPKAAPAVPPGKTRSDDPGLVLISRRPPQQKFSSFEEYMAAHGGANRPPSRTTARTTNNTHSRGQTDLKKKTGALRPYGPSGAGFVYFFSRRARRYSRGLWP